MNSDVGMSYDERPIKEPERLAALHEVRAKIAAGLDEARAGKLLDGETVMKEMEKRFVTRKSSARHRPSRGSSVRSKLAKVRA